MLAHVEETRGLSTKSHGLHFVQRLTASVIKSAARTNHAMTSPSLVKSIAILKFLDIILAA